MKKRIIALCGMASLVMLFSGCKSSGLLTSAHITNIELSKGNFKIVTTSITGQASSKYLFGLSYGTGVYLQTYALIPLTEDRQLYKLAMQDLWKNFEAKYGSPVGKRLALVNIRFDSEALNLFFYLKPTATIIADVIEFAD